MIGGNVVYRDNIAGYHSNRITSKNTLTFTSSCASVSKMMSITNSFILKWPACRYNCFAKYKKTP